MAKDTTGRLHVTVKSGGKRKLSSKLWLERQLNDPYVTQAKRDVIRTFGAKALPYHWGGFVLEGAAKPI